MDQSGNSMGGCITQQHNSTYIRPHKVVPEDDCFYYGPRPLNLTGGHNHFLNSTGGHGHFLKSTCDMGI